MAAPGWKNLKRPESPGAAPAPGWKDLKHPGGPEESPLWLKVMRVPTKPGDAMNAYLRRLGDEARKGSTPGEALAAALGAGWRSGTDLNRDVPPTVLRGMFNLQAGKSGRLAYNLGTVADYILGGFADPANYLAGPLLKGSEAVVSRLPGGARALAAGARAKQAVKGAVAARAGALAEKYVATPLARAANVAIGMGPTRLMMRQIKAQYGHPLSRRFEEAGQIVREMRDWITAHLETQPYFRGVMKGYERGQWQDLQGRPGVEPLTDLVKEYVRRVRNKGLVPRQAPQLLDAADVALLKVQAARRGVPYDVVEHFGQQMLGHAEQTLAELRTSGARPFILARGKSFGAPMSTSAANPPARLLAEMQHELAAMAARNPSTARAAAAYAGNRPNLLAHLVAEYAKVAPTPGSASKGWTAQGRQRVTQLLAGTGIPESVVAGFVRDARRYTQASMRLTFQGAEQRAEQKLREDWFTRYVRQMIARPNVVLSGSIGHAAFSGGGLEEARRAGVRTLIQDLRKTGQWLKEVPVGQQGPPGWLALPHNAKEIAFLAARDKSGKLVAQYWVPPTLHAMIRNELGQAVKVLTKAGRALDVPSDAIQRGVNSVLMGMGRLSGTVKMEMLSSIGGGIKDLVGTSLMSEQALRQEGVGLAGWARGLPAALQEALAHARTGRWGPLGEEMAARNEALSATQAATAVVRSGAQAATEEVLHGRVVPGLGYVPPAKVLAGRVLAWPADMRGVMEQMYKIAMYRALKEKLGPDVAAAKTAHYLLDYADRPLLLKVADQVGLWIFNGFTTGAGRNYIEALATRPDLALRLPRLSRLMRQELQTPAETEGLLRRDQTGYGTVPTSRTEPTFKDLSGYNPFEMTQWLVPTPAQQMAPPESPFAQLPGLLAGHGIYAPLYEQLENRRLYSTPDQEVPIVPPGAPPGQEAQLRARELLRNVLPAWYRPLERGIAAARGRGMRPGKWLEEPNLEQALMSGILGVRTTRAESKGQRKERLEPSMTVRQDALDALWQALDVASGASGPESLTHPKARGYLAQIGADPRFKRNRYQADWGQVTNIDALKSAQQQAKQYLQSLAGTAFDTQGNLVDKNSVIDAYVRWKAITDRLDQAP